MTSKKKKLTRSQNESVEIDDSVRQLLLEGIRKARTQHKLAEVLGYATPTNIIFQFKTAQRYKRRIPVDRFKRLQQFVGQSSSSSENV